jgi:ABC-type transport system involved in cytochrome bd biosynthesis fused ATPase/permease subunit
MRVTAYRRLERLAPAGLPAFRSGDLVSRLVADIDGIADRWLRVLLPYTTAAVAGAGTVCFVALLLPSAALVLAVSLVVAAIVAPWAAGIAARQAERRIAPRRGELAVASLDLLRGCAELLAFGAAEAGLGRAAAADRALGLAEGRSSGGASPRRSPRWPRARQCGPAWCWGYRRSVPGRCREWRSPCWC